MFKYIVMAFLLTSCAPEVIVGPTGPAGSDGADGVDGSDGQQGEKGEQGEAAPVEESLEGYYTLPNGGYLDIYEDSEGLYTVRTSRIVVVNADGSTGLVPVASTTQLPIVNSSLYYTANATYVALTHNVKQDSNNSIFASSLLTQLIFSKVDGIMQVRVVVSSTSSMLFDHTIISTN